MKTVAALAIVAAFAAGGVATQYVGQPAHAAAPVAGATAPQAALPDFASIVQKYGPAVVNITVSGTRKTGFQIEQDDDEDNPLSQFFHGMPFRFGPPPAEVPIRGQGSGFIVGGEGLILTNAHVVQGASEVTVKLTDRREFRAKVLGSDPTSDIAVLRIDAKNLPVVNLGDPARTRVGDWVAAIGSPFGFENSVSAGIVSAKGRSLPGDAYVPFIQTDVAVNPGNSGGPLFNLAGEVIGINSQIYSRSGGYQGLSFAIPIDVALKVKDQIVATGHASHARLGVSVQELNQALADSFGLKRAEGALVSSVMPGSAAERAGLQPGDVIMKFDGKPIVAAAELSAMVGQAAPGDKAKLEVLRKGSTSEFTATLGAVKADPEAKASAQGQDKGRLGLAVRPLTPDERKQLKVSGGLLVEEVNGPAARAGMQPGDVVLMAAGKPVQSVQDLRLAATGSGSVALLVQRGEERVFVPLKLG
ncbi:MAG TPA: DegQ family serine endoprotease [Burkholderiales bacterium]|nr:DegQ family serine endoprotease [Burkholderiales bacterium]